MSTSGGQAPPVFDAGERERERFIADLFAWLRRAGASYYDERVTQLEHALQTAVVIGAQAGVASHLVAAALLHDVGHLLAGEHVGNADFLRADECHEQVGADWLGACLPASVTEAVRLHVPAKRYLCAIDPAYWHGLSSASQQSLIVQGGPMTGEEAIRFAALPGSDDAVRLRLADDQGKQPGRVTPPLEAYAELLRSLLA
jgi:predicted HD phosphohydrolase